MSSVGWKWKLHCIWDPRLVIKAYLGFQSIYWHIVNQYVYPFRLHNEFYNIFWFLHNESPGTHHIISYGYKILIFSHQNFPTLSDTIYIVKHLMGFYSSGIRVFYLTLTQQVSYYYSPTQSIGPFIFVISQSNSFLFGPK